jgi:hypothetical protein
MNEEITENRHQCAINNIKQIAIMKINLSVWDHRPTQYKLLSNGGLLYLERKNIELSRE